MHLRNLSDGIAAFKRRCAANPIFEISYRTHEDFDARADEIATMAKLADVPMIFIIPASGREPEDGRRGDGSGDRSPATPGTP